MSHNKLRLSYLFLLTSYLLLAFSCTQFFEDKVYKDSKSPGTSLSDLISEKVEITQLDAPLEVNVSQAVSPDCNFITWSAVTGADYYRIERAVSNSLDSDGNFIEPDEADYEVLNKFVYSTSFTDEILTTYSYKNEEYGLGYFYRVSAENPRKKYDASDFKVSSPATLFAPVTTVTASQGEDSAYIMVRWQKTANAASYQIWRSQYADGSGSALLATVTGNQNWYKNTVDSAAQGTDFYFTVYAVNSQGYKTCASPVALGYSLVDGAPARVTNVKITTGRGETTDSISLSWDGVAGNNIYYAVYRTSSIDSAAIKLSAKDYAQTTFTDSKNLAPNVYYYYQVMAYTYDEDGTTQLKGPASDSSASSKNPCEGYLLSPPSSLSVVYTPEGSKCVLSFPAALGSTDCPKDSGLSDDYNSYSYRIYTCATQTGNFTYSGDSFSDTSLVPNEGYYSVTVDTAKFYKISTFREDISLESALGTVSAPSPKAASNLTATKKAFISGVTVSGNANDNGVYPVKVTWTAPEGGADGGYYLYRSTKPDSGFRKVQDDPVSSDSTEFIDSYDGAKPGTIYYYRILSLNELKQGANYSNTEQGYGALTADQYMREYNKTIKSSHKKLSLMHKSGTGALGSESRDGTYSGSVSYEAKMDGLGARIIMYYNKYADFYINDDESLGYYFCVTGNTNTSANMSANGSMDGTVTCEGMYPGTVKYNGIEIKGGNAGGGYYVITQEGFEATNVSYTVGNE
ncbi:MAG: fibronectin type III domain-containing protein [Treponema sp.]|nr:fibronectin type III domain-containing protein [Treponema sp.]